MLTPKASTKKKFETGNGRDSYDKRVAETPKNYAAAGPWQEVWSSLVESFRLPFVLPPVEFLSSGFLTLDSAFAGDSAFGGSLSSVLLRMNAQLVP